MEFTLTHPDAGPKSILLLYDGVPYLAHSDHPWFYEIVDLALEDDPRVLELFALCPQELDAEEDAEDSIGAEDLFDALQLFFQLRGIDPMSRSEEDYSDEELAAIRRIYDSYDAPTCDNPECGFCHERSS